MNIVLLNDYGAVLGGADEVAISEAHGLAQAGHKVVFIWGHGETIDPRLRHASITCVNLDAPGVHAGTHRRTILAGLWNRAVGRQVREQLARLPRGEWVVHVHSWTKSLTNAALRAVVQSGHPWVVTCHDYFSVCPNGAFYEFPAGCICPRRPLSAGCVVANCDRRSRAHKVWRVIRQMLLKHFVSWPGAMCEAIVPSRSSGEQLRPWLPSTCRVHVLSSPINAPRSDRVPASSNRRFIYVGRLAAEKGVVDIARAAQAVEAAVTFVGAGEMANAIIAANPNVLITGWVNREEVSQHLRTARALVFPSRWLETQGMVCLEALACGVPVIVASQTGAAEWVVHQQNGWHIKAGNEAELVAALTAFADDELVERLGRKAYDDYWAAPPDQASHVQGLERIYEEIRQRVNAP